MKHRKIPGSQFEVSELGFSVGTLSSLRFKNREREIYHLIRYGLDRGINFFEAADFLGEDGRAETLLGDALYEERDRVVITTKTNAVFRDFEEFKSTRKKKFSPQRIRQSCEESLKRLRTDRIDLYQVHYPDISAVEYEDLYSVLKKLKRQGKILGWGGLFGPETGQLEEASLLIRLRKPATVQLNFNLIEMEPGSEFIENAVKKKIGVLAGVPHCHQLLTQGDLWESSDVWRKPGRRWFEERALQVKQYEFLAVKGMRTLGQAALKFALSSPAVVSAFADIYDEDQLNEYVATSEKKNLTVDEISKVYSLYQEDVPVTVLDEKNPILEY